MSSRESISVPSRSKARPSGRFMAIWRSTKASLYGAGPRSRLRKMSEDSARGEPGSGSPSPRPAEGPPGLPTIDVREYGGKREGARQVLDRRLFMQLLVFDVEGQPDREAEQIARQLGTARVPSVVYADTMDPRSVGVLTWGEDPAHFAANVRPHLQSSALHPRRDYAMIGRTYATGHEPDLEHALLRRSIENVTNEAYRWHVWYPLRRSGAFAKLEP